jgi:hypothetical protein
MTREQTLAYVTNAMNGLTKSKYQDSEKHLAFIYQSGFLQAVIAQAIYNDSHVGTLFRRAVEQAHSKKRRKE